MSNEAIRQVLHELEALPDSDQQLVLHFLSALKSQRAPTSAPAASNGDSPALRERHGLLVFTGRLDAPQTDWLQIVRDERDEELMRPAAGDGTSR